jgi:type III secretion protein L
MVVLKPTNLTLLPEQKVIKAADYAVVVEAEQIIAQAQAQAAALVAQAMADYEAEKKRGYEDGLAEGQERIAEKMLNTVTEAVNYFGSLERKVVEVVMQALRRIVGEMDSNEMILRVVKNSLEVARTQKQVTLRASPSQVDYLRSQLNEILAQFPSINYIDVTADSRLKPGGCILETEMGFVDASVEVQLEAIRKSLLKATAHVP